MSFTTWRHVHRASSAIVGVIALIHCAMTFTVYREWSPEAAWFLGTGIGLLANAGMNWAHVGLEPCRLPTAPVLRWTDWLFVGLGLAALYAVREPQAVIIIAALLGQAVASIVTLPGPSKGETEGT